VSRVNRPRTVRHFANNDRNIKSCLS